jgi:hypothetical protein
VPFRVPVDLFDRIERERGLVPRERFLRALVEAGLNRREADRDAGHNDGRRAG